MTQSTSLYFQRSAEQLSSLQKDLGKSQMQLGSGVRPQRRPTDRDRDHSADLDTSA